MPVLLYATVYQKYFVQFDTHSTNSALCFHLCVLEMLFHYLAKVIEKINSVKIHTFKPTQKEYSIRAANALNPRVTMSSATMVLIMSVKQVPVIHEEGI